MLKVYIDFKSMLILETHTVSKHILPNWITNQKIVWFNVIDLVDDNTQ